jgi:hypothetical protein
MPPTAVEVGIEQVVLMTGWAVCLSSVDHDRVIWYAPRVLADSDGFQVGRVDAGFYAA